jgi:hypothetical protein
MTAPALRRRAMGLVVAGAGFVALTLGAMVVYRGGSRFEPRAAHYQFFGNFFSDLGTSVTYSGRANTVARALFVTSLASVGAAFAWSGRIWAGWAGRGVALGAAKVARAVTVLVGIGVVGIGITPWNREQGVHLALVQGSFALLLVFVVSVIVLQVRNEMPWRWIGANLALVVGLAFYVALVTVGPSTASLGGLRIQVVTQKLVVYAAIANLVVQAWGVTRCNTRRSPVGAPRAIRHGAVSPTAVARSTISNGPRRNRPSQRPASMANTSQNVSDASR